MSDNDADPNIAAIDLLKEAAAQYVEEVDDDGAVMTSAVIVWETSTMAEDGGIEYESNYALITDTSLSNAVGLMSVGKAMLLRDAMEDDDE